MEWWWAECSRHTLNCWLWGCCYCCCCCCWYYWIDVTTWPDVSRPCWWLRVVMVWGYKQYFRWHGCLCRHCQHPLVRPTRPECCWRCVFLRPNDRHELPPHEGRESCGEWQKKKNIETNISQELNIKDFLCGILL